jgi:hypothetical protein
LGGFPIDEKGGIYETSVHFVTRSYHIDGSYRDQWIIGFSPASEVKFQG